jgi:hypothetical protein
VQLYLRIRKRAFLLCDHAPNDSFADTQPGFISVKIWLVAVLVLVHDESPNAWRKPTQIESVTVLMQLRCISLARAPQKQKELAKSYSNTQAQAGIFVSSQDIVKDNNGGGNKKSCESETAAKGKVQVPRAT